jgi:hypothetical protein
MGFPALGIESARGLVEKRLKGEEWFDARLERVVESTFDFDRNSVDKLADELAIVRERFGGKYLPKNKGKGFEADACVIVHQRLRLSPECASSPEFWAWLTLLAADGLFAEIVDWRFGGYDSIKPRNYGIARPSEIFEGLFARLWFRGEMAYEPKAKDPYTLAKRGDIDIWRSHLFRQEFGRCYAVQRALLRYQYPDANPTKKTMSTGEIRKLVKRLRIANATLSYELLDVETVTEVISTIVQELRA